MNGYAHYALKSEKLTNWHAAALKTGKEIGFPSRNP